MMKHLRITVDGRAYDVIVEDFSDPVRSGAPAPTPAAYAAAAPSAPPAAAPTPAAPPPPAASAPSASSAPPSGGPDDRLAPLAGVVLEVSVSVGDMVEVDDQVVVLEAMKMKTVIGAHKAGRVAAVHVKQGDAVDSDQPLVTIQ
jgi:biotin carboxyl carrier protein